VLWGILAEVAYVDALMVRELPDGSLQNVDGDLRAETTPDALGSVLVVDLDDKETDKVLATFDPLWGCACLVPTLLHRRAILGFDDGQPAAQIPIVRAHPAPLRPDCSKPALPSGKCGIPRAKWMPSPAAATVLLWGKLGAGAPRRLSCARGTKTAARRNTA